MRKTIRIDEPTNENLFLIFLSFSFSFSLSSTRSDWRQFIMEILLTLRAYLLRETNRDSTHLWSLDSENMATTIKSSFLIDDLLSAFKRPTTNPTIPTTPPNSSTSTNSNNKETVSHPSSTSSDLPTPTNFSLNFFQPANQFNQYAAIKPELHPFFFHGKFDVDAPGGRLIENLSVLFKTTMSSLRWLMRISFIFILIGSTSLTKNKGKKRHLSNSFVSIRFFSFFK